MKSNEAYQDKKEAEFIQNREEAETQTYSEAFPVDDSKLTPDTTELHEAIKKTEEETEEDKERYETHDGDEGDVVNIE